MRRTFLLLLGVVAATWLEFQFFPGHTYLQADTQIYLPILERLDTPGFLSRDLVATHPNVAHTIYDEVTLFLHEAVHLDFRTALTAQQVLCRSAGVCGVFLLALSTGVGDLFAFLVAILVNLGATLIGPAVLLVDREPVPSAFALGLTFLAAGLIAREKPLLSGLTGGVAFLYEPAIASPFWAVLIAAFIFDARLRRLLRPALPIFLIFVLLLANLAQLQPGIVESQDFFSKVSEPFAELERYRTKFIWVGLWARHDMWHYAAILVCGFWATARIWQGLKPQVRWLFVSLPLCGVAGVLLSGLLLDRLRWSLIAEIQPARALLFTVAFSTLASALAGMRAATRRKYLEACLWFIVVFTLPMNVQILDLFALTNRSDVPTLSLSILLALTLVLLVAQLGQTKGKGLVLLLPLGAIFAMAAVSHVNAAPEIDRRPIREIARWAEENTWGSSMFLFPDAGRDLYPGIFRAESRRALWADWESGRLVPYFESFATEWWDRWQETMQQQFSAERLQAMLSLPIDYYVLKRENQLETIPPVFANRDFVVYDAIDLKNAKAPLHAMIDTLHR